MNAHKSGLQERGKTPKDGNCMFHAIAEQMESEHSHISLRRLAVETLNEGFDGVSRLG